MGVVLLSKFIILLLHEHGLDIKREKEKCSGIQTKGTIDNCELTKKSLEQSEE
jgi:hypothetical protein